MATGNQALPGAPVTAERAMTAHPSQVKPRRGAGGRWLVWGLRGVVWIVLALIAFRGVAAIVMGTPLAGGVTQAVARAPAPAFPAQLAEAYALEFGQVYLDFSPASAGRRASSLAAFLPVGASPQFGWSGQGTQRLDSVQIAGIKIDDAHNAVVTLLARVNGQLIDVGVPIYAAHGGMVVSGQPALLPAPAGVTLPVASAVAAGPRTTQSIRHFLPTFFRAFASGNDLGRYLDNGVRVAGLNGVVTLAKIEHVTVASGSGAAKKALVTVAWLADGTASAQGAAGASAPARIAMTYAMTLVRRGGAWYVRSIGAATTLAGASS